MERKEGEKQGGGGWRGRRGEVLRRMGRNEGAEGGRETVRRRMERKGEKGSEEDDYFNKFHPTMPSVVLENRSIRMFEVSYRSALK
jgi:hypothetical protein